MTDTVPCKLMYEIWTTPTQGNSWDDTHTDEKRPVFYNATDREAELLLMALKWAGCDCEKRTVYTPVEGETK